MIYLGPGGLPTITKGDTIQGLKDLKSIGLNFMEVEFVHSVYLKKEKATEIGKFAKELGIGLSIHAPYFINFGNPEKFPSSKKRILDSCEIGHYLGAKYIVFHPAFYGKFDKGAVYKMVLRNCLEMQDVILKNNWDVVLGMETTGKKSQFGTLDELVRLSGETKVCPPVVDFSHIYARQGGNINYEDVLDKMKPFKHIHSHFSNIEFTDAGERRHMVLGESGPDFKELAKEVVRRNLDITIICETPLLEQDSLKMKGIIEKVSN